MKKEKTTIHFTDTYLLNPVHRISVALIGAGGSGSQMLSSLARIDLALRKLGKAGLFVTVYDNDTVQEPNIGRQLFTAADLGQNKADCLVTRFNRIYGNDWNTKQKTFDGRSNENIIITCVDNTKTRLDTANFLKDLKSHNLNSKEFRNYYWLDLGNGQTSGQAVLGTPSELAQPQSTEFKTVGKLKCITDIFDLTQVDEKESGPSCSLAEALEKQDLFINSTLVQASASLLWNLLNDGFITSQGFFLNLEDFRMNPIKIS